MRKPVQILETGPLVGTVILVSPLWRYDFLGLCPRQCIFWIALGSIKTFQLRAISLEWFPPLVGNCLGCAVAQARSSFVPFIPLMLSSAWGVRAGLLWGLTPPTPHFHWLIDIDRSVLLLSVLYQYLGWLMLGSPWGILRCWLLPPPFRLAFLVGLTVGSSCETTFLICWKR